MRINKNSIDHSNLGTSKGNATILGIESIYKPDRPKSRDGVNATTVGHHASNLTYSSR